MRNSKGQKSEINEELERVSGGLGSTPGMKREHLDGYFEADTWRPLYKIAT